MKNTTIFMGLGVITFMTILSIISNYQHYILKVRLNQIVIQQNQIIAHLTYPPEFQRVFYDPAVETPKKERTHITRNEKLIPKKPDQGAPHD